MLEMRNVTKRYFIGEPHEITVLKGISLDIREGEFVSIVGQSGSGKSTMMNILGALDRPTSGEYWLNGDDVAGMRDSELSKIRNRKIGFVFQTFNLIPRVTALENVEMPMFYKGVGGRESRERAKWLLQLVGMADRGRHMPNELSGGQKQRVAIARSLANDPDVILADEPTGALDSATGDLIMNIFLQINTDKEKTIVLITHNKELACLTDRIITLRDGEIIGDRSAREGAAV